MRENDIGTKIIEAAIAVHKNLGPGLLESVYETVLAYELTKRSLHVQRQVVIPVHYEALTFEEGFRADLIVENKVIIELKSIERVSPAHKKQLLTYLRLSEKKLGYLINFSEETLREGVTRVVNGLDESDSRRDADEAEKK